MGKNSVGKLFVVSAPSGAGKTTLVTEVIKRMAPLCPIARVVTYTTKPARPGEDRHGIDYHYLTAQEFEAKIAQGFFWEWSNAYGHYYGSPKAVLDDIAQGFSRILILDRAGAQAIKQQFPAVVLVWIYTKDMQVLKERLFGRSRGVDGADQIAHRLALARTEIEQEQHTKLYAYHVLNDCLQRAILEFEAVIKKELLGQSVRDQKDFVQKNLQGL